MFIFTLISFSLIYNIYIRLQREGIISKTWNQYLWLTLEAEADFCPGRTFAHLREQEKKCIHSGCVRLGGTFLVSTNLLTIQVFFYMLPKIVQLLLSCRVSKLVIKCFTYIIFYHFFKNKKQKSKHLGTGMPVENFK